MSIQTTNDTRGVSASGPMRGASSAETCILNGWGVGTILRGSEGRGDDEIRITAIGESCILARWRYKCMGSWGTETTTTLHVREWRKVEP